MHLFLYIFTTTLITCASTDGNVLPLLLQRMLLLDEKIVGGEDISIEKVPYQVSVQSEGHHRCGGSLIKANVVLSAAHCYQGINKVQVRAGSAHHENGGELINSKSVLKHPKYNDDNVDYDAAVIILEKSFTLSAQIGLIKLQPEGSEVQDGKMGLVSGWGDIKEGSAIGSSILQAVNLPKYNTKTCTEAYSNTDGPITDRMVCFGIAEGGKSSCQGDSGGPIVVDGYQVGIESFAVGCARPKYPTVFAKVSNQEITSFILNNVG